MLQVNAVADRKRPMDGHIGIACQTARHFAIIDFPLTQEA